MTRRRPTDLEHERLFAFANATINLSDVAKMRYCRAVARVLGRLSPILARDGTYVLFRAFICGSIAKHTAIRSTPDIDLALYLTPVTPAGSDLLLEWLLARLREAEPDLAVEQFISQDHSVRVVYQDSAKVDVVPVIATPDNSGNGYLVDRQTGGRTLTNIPRHLQFARLRDRRTEGHYLQIVRLVKWWARHRKDGDPRFKFKPILTELLCAHLIDEGLALSHYLDALRGFFGYIVRSKLRKLVMFEDYYSRAVVASQTKTSITVLDPANSADNVVAGYTEADRLAIIAAAESSLAALDDVTDAVSHDRVRIAWHTLFGDAFQV
jgi:hypothetical protein